MFEQQIWRKQHLLDSHDYGSLQNAWMEYQETEANPQMYSQGLISDAQYGD